MNFFVLIILLFFVVVPIGQAIARAIETRSDRSRLPLTSEPSRLEELERRVDDLVERIEAMQESQEFMTRLLENRPAGLPPAQREEEVT